MDRTPVKSGLIKSVGYENGTLEVEFLRGGNVYQYTEVSPEKANDFVNAPSVGKYFLANIKDKFPTTKATP